MGKSRLNRSITGAFSALFPVLFVLNGYGIGSISIGIGSFVLVFFLLLSLIDSNKMKKTVDDLRPLLLLFALIFISLIDFLFEPQIDYGGLFVTLFKMSVWALSITFLSSAYLDLDIFVPHFRSLCLISTAYLILQNVSWVLFRVFIPNLYTIGPIHPLYEQYSQDTLKAYIERTDLTRFASFFSEPAFYGHLMIVYLTLLLYHKKKDPITPKTLLEVVFLSLGVILSTSTAAIVFLVAILGWYMISSKRIKPLLILVGIIMAGYIVLRFSPLKNYATVSYFFRKITNMDELGRVGKSYENLNKLSLRQLLLGVGIGNTSVIVPGYLNSFSSIIISFGILGFLLYLVCVITYIIKKKHEVITILLLTYLVSSFQGATAFSLIGILFFSVVMAYIQKERINQKRMLLGSSYE